MSKYTWLQSMCAETLQLGPFAGVSPKSMLSWWVGNMCCHAYYAVRAESSLYARPIICTCQSASLTNCTVRVGSDVDHNVPVQTLAVIDQHNTHSLSCACTCPPFHNLKFSLI